MERVLEDVARMGLGSVDVGFLNPTYGSKNADTSAWACNDSGVSDS
jgi:hypothetical protein